MVPAYALSYGSSSRLLLWVARPRHGAPNQSTTTRLTPPLNQSACMICHYISSAYWSRIQLNEERTEPGKSKAQATCIIKNIVLKSGPAGRPGFGTDPGLNKNPPESWSSKNRSIRNPVDPVNPANTRLPSWQRKATIV